MSDDLAAAAWNLEEAEAAWQRVKPEIDRLTELELSPLNVDIESAAAIALRSASRMSAWRDRIARIDEFDIRNIDRLADYAMTAWFLHVTNLPQAEALAGLDEEVVALRRRLLMFAEPLSQLGIFDRATIKRIRKNRGIKQRAGDLVALATLYRAHWEQVRAMCGVTDEDLERASKVGAAMFEAACRRERATATPREGRLLVRKAWTLLDRAYTQCRRAVTFIRYVEGDYDELLPSLRRNAGNAGRGREVRVRADGTLVSPGS